MNANLTHSCCDVHKCMFQECHNFCAHCPVTVILMTIMWMQLLLACPALASVPGHFGREKRPGNFCQFKLLFLLPESWKSQSDFRSLSHDNSKPNCVMRWNVTVTPIHHNSWSLDHASVGALHDDFYSFVFCLPSVAEPAQTVASTSRKGPFSAGENIRSITWTSLIEWGMQLPWRYVRKQFELAEVARPFSFPKRPGNEASPAHESTSLRLALQCPAFH